MTSAQSLLPAARRELAARITALAGPRPPRIVLHGPPGSGKSTLAAGLAAELTLAGHTVTCIGVDPGTPAFGVPGALCRARWRDGGWEMTALQPLCSLDAARYRLPLIEALRRLLDGVSEGDVILFDSPGVVRGVAGAELLIALVSASDAAAIVPITAPGRDPALAAELSALAIPVWPVVAAAGAHRPSKASRQRMRTALWDNYLAGGGVAEIDLNAVTCLGMPPPAAADAVWCGRQVALYGANGSPVMGEVEAAADGRLRVRSASALAGISRLLVRDAHRGGDGLLVTAAPAGGRLASAVAPQVASADRAASGAPVRAEVGPVSATLVNGAFGDPLLHLRLRHARRSLLFDLGDGRRLPARTFHQVTDVFISHAHADHIGGFLSLLRSRLGDFPACRLYGPPGLAGHIEGLVRGICWDRIGEAGPSFEVAEWGGERLDLFSIKAGRSGCRRLGERRAHDGVLLKDHDFAVRAVLLDHGIPVLAFAFEPPLRVNVRAERLRAAGLAPGPWLTALKRAAAAQALHGQLALPDDSRRELAELAEQLLIVTPGEKLVYATDLADTPDNRERLAALAQGAHTLFCEAPFLSSDRDQALRTGHLTVTACGEIARAAGVGRLIGFHFSRRYRDDPAQLYRELAVACGPAVSGFGGP